MISTLSPTDPLRTARRFRPALESLEDRTVPAVLGPEPLYDPTTIIVRFRPEAGPVSALPGTTVGERLQLVPGLYVVNLANGVSVPAAVAAYQANPAVLYAEPNGLFHTALTPNDPLFNQLWGMQRIEATQAWDANTGSGRVIVAVIDTGIDFDHPDLRANVWRNPGEIPNNKIDDDGNGYVDDVYGYDFINRDSEPYDDNAHGTHVSGTIGALGNNGIGVAGLNWRIQIMALKAFRANGSGTFSAVVQALHYALTQGAILSNNSYTCTVSCSAQSFQEALAIARAYNHVFVAAAGNAGTDNDVRPHYPASFASDNVVAVAATEPDDRLADYSNFGRTSVDLSAPGSEILSTSPENDYRLLWGTSMATPHVTGVMALIRDLRPHWSYQQVIDQVLRTVDPVPSQQGRTVTGGRLNARRAVPVCSNANPVVWTGGGGDLLWSNLRNWSSCTLPGPTADVVIDVPGDVVITGIPSNTTVRSLLSQEQLAITAGVTLTVTAGAQLAGGLSVEGLGSAFRTAGASSIGGPLDNRSSLEVQGGTLRLSATGTSTGAFRIAAGATVEFGSDFVEVAALSGAGNVRVTGGWVQFGNGYDLTGTTQVDAPAAAFFNGSGRSGPFLNAGFVWLGPEGTFTVNGDYTQTAGSTELYGIVNVAAGRLLNLAGGTLAGAGTIQGNLRNAARIEVGGPASAGWLRLEGDYTQTAAGTLSLELGSWDAGEFDLFEVTGRATLDGTLTVGLLPGFTARADDFFPLLLFGSRTGTFRTLTLPNLGGGLFLDPFYEESYFALWTQRH